MDGTLVDVSQSYREAAPVAAARYLQLLGIVPPPLTGDSYDQFKLMGGFNDDWDLTSGLIELLVSELPPALPVPEPVGGVWPDQAGLLAELQRAAAPLAGLSAPAPDYARVTEAVRAAGGGHAGLRRITGGRNSQLVRHSGSAALGDLVQRVFAEIYLGADFFPRIYHLPARFNDAPGLLHHEELLISIEILERLAAFARLGIATGRADFEMEPALERFDLRRLFPVSAAIATMNDAVAAQAPGGPSLLKPAPYLLERAADALDPSRRLLAAYVGDTRDDVIAVQRARRPADDPDRPARPWLSIALATAADKARFRAQFLALGADAVLDHPDEIAELWG
jgi:phosphoglycolate phosphatase-like HAD superfamily hydrolase